SSAVVCTSISGATPTPSNGDPSGKKTRLAYEAGRYANPSAVVPRSAAYGRELNELLLRTRYRVAQLPVSWSRSDLFRLRLIQLRERRQCVLCLLNIAVPLVRLRKTRIHGCISRIEFPRLFEMHN